VEGAIREPPNYPAKGGLACDPWGGLSCQLPRFQGQGASETQHTRPHNYKTVTSQGPKVNPFLEQARSVSHIWARPLYRLQSTHTTARALPSYAEHALEHAK
jgi:hypothetical protein